MKINFYFRDIGILFAAMPIIGFVSNCSSARAEDLFGGHWGWLLPSVSKHIGVDGIYRNLNDHAVVLYSELSGRGTSTWYEFDLSTGKLIEKLESPTSGAGNTVRSDLNRQLMTPETGLIAEKAFPRFDFDDLESTCELNLNWYNVPAGSNKKIKLVYLDKTALRPKSNCWNSNFGSAGSRVRGVDFRLDSMPDGTFLLWPYQSDRLVRIDRAAHSPFADGNHGLFFVDAERLDAAITQFENDRNEIRFESAVISARISS